MLRILLMGVLAISVAGMEQDSLRRAVEAETAWDRLLVGANRYVNAKDTGYEKWKKVLEARISQKMEDGKLSEAAAGEVYATEYLAGKRVVLVKGPGKDADGKEVDREIVLDIARHIRYALEKKIVVSNWRLYEREVLIWGAWFLSQTETQ